MILDKNKVMVGISGGVDSAVCTDLLKKSGYDVYGTVIRFGKHSESAVIDAQKVAQQLNIPLEIADAECAFYKNVITPFCESYINGITPNPCIVCNPLVKFATLINYADKNGIYYIATGHYAQIIKTDDIYYVKQAKSAAKDQSYMLYRLPQSILSRLLLPVGEFEKQNIRAAAENISLFNAQKPDSQEICFIPQGDHRSYIESLGYNGKSGYFIAPDGKKIKKHNGIHNYTVGQRKGLGIALGQPVFVKEISPEGDIYLSYAGGDCFSSVTINSPVYTDGKPFAVGDEFIVKIRSAHKGALAKIIYSDNEKIEILFNEPVRAVAKGQSAVFYKDSLVAGGGFIVKAL